jgi:hypothetical protein
VIGVARPEDVVVDPLEIQERLDQIVLLDRMLSFVQQGHRLGLQYASSPFN